MDKLEEMEEFLEKYNLLSVLDLNSILSDISIVTPALFLLEFAWNSFLSPLLSAYVFP